MSILDDLIEDRLLLCDILLEKLQEKIIAMSLFVEFVAMVASSTKVSMYDRTIVTIAQKMASRNFVP